MLKRLLLLSALLTVFQSMLAFTWGVWECTITGEKLVSIRPNYEALKQIPGENTLYVPEYVYDGNTNTEYRVERMQGLYPYSDVIDVVEQYTTLEVPAADMTINCEGWSSLKNVFFRYSRENRITLETRSFGGCENLETIATYMPDKQGWYSDCISPCFKNLPAYGLYSGASKLSMSATLFAGLEVDRDAQSFAGTKGCTLNVPADYSGILPAGLTRDVKQLNIESSDEPLEVIPSDGEYFGYFESYPLESIRLGRKLVNGSGRVYLTAPNLKSLYLNCPEMDNPVRCTNNLTTITIGREVKSICYGAFQTYPVTDPDDKYKNYGCPELTYVFFDDGCSLRTIPSHCFAGCSKLIQFLIPSSVEEIQDYALAGAGANMSFFVPETVKQMDVTSFADSPYITIWGGAEDLKITNSSTIYDDYTSYPAREVYLYRQLSYYRDLYPIRNVENLYIGGNLSKVPSYLSTNVGEVHFLAQDEDTPSQLKTIGYNAFNGLKMESIVFPEQLETLESFTWDPCYTANMELGKNLKKFNLDDMYHYPALENIKIRAMEPPAVGSQFNFDLLDSNRSAADISLIIPKEAINAYKTDDHWKVFFTDHYQLSLNLPSGCEDLCYLGVNNTAGDTAGAPDYQAGDLETTSPYAGDRIYLEDDFAHLVGSKATVTVCFNIPEGNQLKSVRLNDIELIQEVTDDRLTLTLSKDSTLSIRLKSSGITDVISDGANSYTGECYNLMGHRVSEHTKGVILKRTASGRFEKVIQ